MVSPSLITRFFWKGTLNENICYKKVYHTNILNDVYNPSTRVQNYGNYFESMTIGKHLKEGVFDLPRKLNGGKTADHLRIDEQIHNFDRVCEMHKIEVDPEYVQFHKKYHFEMSDEFKRKHDVIVLVSHTIDFISPLQLEDNYFKRIVIDLKLPRDRDGGFGKYNWEHPQSLDHTQIIMYSLLTGLPGTYLLFDYKPRDYGYKFVPVLTTAYLEALGVKDENYIMEANNRNKELFKSIENTVELIIQKDALGWDEYPSAENCKGCPLSSKMGGTCNLFTEIKTV